jgi:hypothetical protein
MRGSRDVHRRMTPLGRIDVSDAGLRWMTLNQAFGVTL